MLTIELEMPFVLENKLPCPLQFSLSTRDRPFSAFPKAGEGVASGTIQPGGRAQVSLNRHVAHSYAFS